jgi:hypothetical protein
LPPGISPGTDPNRGPDRSPRRQTTETDPEDRLRTQNDDGTSGDFGAVVVSL